MDDIGIWQHKVLAASDEELRALHEADYLGLTDINEGWRAYVRIIQDEILRRGIDCDLNKLSPPSARFKIPRSKMA